jgi:hypothetical protein
VRTYALLAFTLAACLGAASPDVPSSPEPAPPAEAAPAPSLSPSSQPAPAPSGHASRAACDDAGFLALETEHATGYHEVTVCGNVAQVLPERVTASGRHKYFLITIDPAGDTIEVATNVEITGEFDVKVGALANVRGRYSRDTIGTQVIDWTHHNAERSVWPFPGYVQLDGGPLID